jgi:hypothetical protein
MAFFQRPSNAPHPLAKAASYAGRGLLATLVLLAWSCQKADGQIGDGTGKLSNASAYLTVGGENTQFPFYSDNALGFDMGVSYQPHALVGAEFRSGAYPISARYTQMAFMGGYRIQKQTILGFPYETFLYFGGGLARSQDKGVGRTAYAPEWAPCWQADLGFDRDYGRFSWRVAQFSLRETYTPLHTLKSVGLSTGVVYHFPR